MKYVNLQQGSQEWLEFRRDKVGGSDIPNILGVGYKSAQQLLRDKVYGQKDHSEYTLQLFEKGHATEDLVRSDINKSGYNFVPAVIQDDVDERFFTSLDGIDEENKAILEVKYTTKQDVFASLHNLESKIPDLYYSQIQWSLMISGVEKCFLVVVHGGYPVTRTVEPDKTIWPKLLDAARLFISELDQKVANRKAFAESAQAGQLSSQIALLIEMKKDLKAKLEKVDDDVKFRADKLLKMFNATSIETDQITIKTVTRAGNVDYSKIPELKGVELDKYRKKSTSFLDIKAKSQDTTENTTNNNTKEIGND